MQVAADMGDLQILCLSRERQLRLRSVLCGPSSVLMPYRVLLQTCFGAASLINDIRKICLSYHSVEKLHASEHKIPRILEPRPGIEPGTYSFLAGDTRLSLHH